MEYTFEQFPIDTTNVINNLILMEQHDKKGKIRDVSSNNSELKLLRLHHMMNTVKRRKLPISFSTYGLLAISQLDKTAHEQEVIVGDFLERFEGQKLTAKTILELYPNGFYSEESVDKRVQEIIGTSKKEGKWAKLFIPEMFLEAGYKEYLEIICVRYFIVFQHEGYLPLP